MNIQIHGRFRDCRYETKTKDRDEAKTADVFSNIAVAIDEISSRMMIFTHSVRRSLIITSSDSDFGAYLIGLHVEVIR